MRKTIAASCFGLSLVGCSKLIEDLKRGGAGAAATAPVVASAVSTEGTAKRRPNASADGTVTGTATAGVDLPAPATANRAVLGGTALAAAPGPWLAKHDGAPGFGLGVLAIQSGGFVQTGFGVCGEALDLLNGGAGRGKRTCALTGRKLGGVPPQAAELPILPHEGLPDPKGRIWKYGLRIRMSVLAGSDTRDVMYGGALDNETPVYPIKVSLPADATPVSKFTGSSDGVPRYTAIARAFVLSDDARSIGGYAEFVLFNASQVDRVEFGAAYSAFAWDVDLFAAGVVQEYGYRLYGQKKYTEAAAKFADAAATAPRWELPRYNEACAWALASEPARAEVTLGDAIVRAAALGNAGGDVKKRAKDDKDFAAYKTADWFVRITE
jgi:hypothetical protein